MNFIFYDFEATGAEPLHDQMLSAGAVLTDSALAERESFSLRCRLKPHQLPAPAALMITGLTLSAITAGELPSHYEMVSALQARLSAWSPAVFVGYSSLEFDEPLLEEAFRACLHPAGLMLACGSARLDVQRLALALHSFAPAAIAFTTRHDGQPSFRLSEVARANGIAHEQAHDALGDVRTTIAVARLIAARAPWLWDHMIAMGREEGALRFSLSDPVRLYTEFHHNRPHHWLVTAIADAPDARGELLAFDLSQDPEEGRALEGDALARWLTRHPKPLRPIKLRDCPFVLPQERANGLVDIAPAEAVRRARLLREDAAYRQRLADAHALLPKEEAPPPAAAEWPGFHALSWEERARRLGGIADPVLKARAERLLFDERPALLDPATRTRLERQTAGSMLQDDGKAPWMTLARAFELTDAAFEHASPEDVERLEELLAYLRAELAWAEERA